MPSLRNSHVHTPPPNHPDRGHAATPIAAPYPTAHQLEREQQLLAGWMVRLKRSINAYLKHQGRVSRCEREIRQLETRNGTYH